MVSKVRFNAEGDDSTIVTRHPARSQKSIARSRICVYVVAAQTLPPTSGGYSAVSARTPAPRQSTGLTYYNERSCGLVAPELLPPATSCRHTGQMYCSDMLSISIDLRLQRGASKPILTNKRTNIARERSLGPPDAKRAQDLCYTLAV